MYRAGIIALTTFALILPGLPAGDATAETFAAFDKYAKQRETVIWTEIRNPEKFFWVDRLPDAKRQKAYQNLRAGQVLIDQGRRSEISGGLIHHWTGLVYVPNVNLQQVMNFIKDYNRHVSYFSPELMASKLISREDNKYRIYQRYRKKKVITVVLDTEHLVNFYDLDPTRSASFGYTVKVNEVDDPGTPHEKQLPMGKDTGFLWKMDTYWRFYQRDGGVYVQCETISLTRTIPFGLGVVIGRFIDSVPKESLNFTLLRTREKAPTVK